tara:strand:+ start:699 stop:1457 length:759 start_codon:yes stop_codon:yes gene_type:complete
MDAINLSNNYSHEAQDIQGQITAFNNNLMNSYHGQLLAQRGADAQKLSADLQNLGERGVQLGQRVYAYRGAPSFKARYSGASQKPTMPESEGTELEGEAREGGTGIDSLGEDEQLGKDLLKDGAEGVGEKVAKYGIRAGVIGLAGMDLAEDIEGGKKGWDARNWEQNTENVGNIVGGGLEIGAMAVPFLAPELELAGAVVSGVSDIIGDIGDIRQSEKQKQAIEEQPKMQEAQIVAPVTLAQEGLVAQQKTA